MSLQDMTQTKWDRLSHSEREALRDNSGLSPQLIGKEYQSVKMLYKAR